MHNQVNSCPALSLRLSNSNSICLCNAGLLALCAQDCVVIIECLRHPNQMRHRGEQDEDVEQLVRTAPDVKSFGEASLWPTYL